MRRIVFIFRKLVDIPAIFIDDMSRKYGSNGRLRNFAIQSYIIREKKVRWKRQKRDC